LSEGIMSTEALSRFQQIRGRRMESPSFRERYQRTRRTIDSVQEIVGLIDQRRREAGISKAELARRAGMNPAALRRLLTSGAGNPTLLTVLGLMAALDIQFRLVVPRTMPAADGELKHSIAALQEIRPDSETVRRLS
jgi:DNA-binding phage protein